MKHRRVKIFISIIFLVILNVVPTYASDIFYWNGTMVQDYEGESIILPKEVKQSKTQVKGNVISTGFLDITNGGKGKVELTIQTLAHVPCDRLCNALTLQVWNESLGDWVQVERFEFEANQKDQPDEELNYLINGVDVENLPTGVYRARGLHAVYLDDIYESYASRTNGIQIYK